MSNYDSGTTISIVITLVLVAAVALVLFLAGSSFAGAFLLVAAIVLAVFILLVILITVFTIGIGSKDRERAAFAAHTAVIPEDIRAADHVILNIIAVMEAVHDPEVKASAGKLCGQCRMINDIAARQPEELFKAAGFFRSLLPLFLTMMESYVSLEPSGDVDLQGRTLSCMAGFTVLFDRQYRAFFTTESCDLSSEALELESVLKKNRLC